MVPVVLALVPPILLVRAVVRDATDVPWMDQWTFAREVVRTHDGTFRLARLWDLHNEHRVPVPKIVMHVLAALSDWDVRWEVAATVGVGLGSLLVVGWLLARTVPPAAAGVLFLVASGLQCSLVQWQNWTWGWQLGLLLAQACAVGVGAALLRVADAPLRWAATAMAVAVVGALSSGQGLTLLAIAPLGLVLCRWAGARVPVAAMLAAVAVSTVTVAAYAYGWAPPVGQPPPRPIAGRESQLIEYALTSLGAPIASQDRVLAWRWGVAVCAVAAVATPIVWFGAPRRRRTAIPWIALAAFSVGTALLTASGRAAAGAHTALLSRYTTFAIPLWIAAGPLIALAVTVLPGRVLRGVVVAAFVPVVALAGRDGLRSWQYGDVRMAGRALTERRAAAVCLADVEAAPDSCWLGICWDARHARERALELRQYRLGPWRQ